MRCGLRQVECDVGRNARHEVKLEWRVREVVQDGFTPLNFALETVAEIDDIVDAESRVSPSGLSGVVLMCCVGCGVGVHVGGTHAGSRPHRLLSIKVRSA